MSDLYNLYLTENGKEELLKSASDPSSIRHILVGKRMRRRLRKQGTTIRATRNGKNLRLDALEQLCLDQWFTEAEENRSE